MHDDVSFDRSSILKYDGAIFVGTLYLFPLTKISAQVQIVHFLDGYELMGPHSPGIRTFTIEWSHMLSYPGCLLGVSSVSDLLATRTSLANWAMSLEISTALAELPIITTTCQLRTSKITLDQITLPLPC